MANAAMKKRSKLKLVKTKKTVQGRSSKTGAKVPKNTEVVRSIGKLHKEIQLAIKVSLKNGIAIGQILTKAKKELGHRNWTPWIKAYLPFSQRTATNYMNLYKYKSEIKLANVSNLKAAYAMLANAQNHHRSITRQETREMRKKFANKKSNYKNPKDGNYVNQIIAGNNCNVMKKMLRHGMDGKYTGIISSPPYNAGFNYSDNFDDKKPYGSYLKDLLKPFPLYSELLCSGGRVIYVIGSIVKNENRHEIGDYNHQIIDDLKAGVKEVAPDLRLLNQIIWYKGGAVKDPLNTQYGTLADPRLPVTRSCHEIILVWSNKQYELENIENTEPDINLEEFKKMAWSVWEISPYSKAGNPHPCSYPPRLISQLVKFYSYPKSLILDPYAGACTTAEVCKKLGRKYTCIDLNPNYCDYGSEQLKSA